MTSKERVLCSLSWREPDRVPVEAYLTPEIEARLKAHFRGRDVYECLEVDFRRISPAYRPKKNHPAAPCTTRQITTTTGATYTEAVSFPLAELKTLAEVDNYPWPDPDAYDYSVIPGLCERFRDYAVSVGGEGTPDILNGLSRQRGMEQVMMDIATRDPVGLAIIDRHVDSQYEILRRSLRAGAGRIDIVRLGEDCGNQNGRMFSPRDFEDIFRPHLQRLIDLAHEFGAKAMLHSCGDTHELMPAFMAMNLDILDAMQPEPAGMDPERIRALCKGRLAFCGLISTQRTLPYGTVSQCRAEARHRLDVIARGGGYIFTPAHCVQPDTPLENVLAIYEEALGKKLG
jgi:uroporphyrinogen decarboxylase